MTTLQYVTRPARLIARSAPVRLVALVLEKSTQLVADAIDAVAGGAKSTDSPTQHVQEIGQGDREGGQVDGEGGQGDRESGQVDGEAGPDEREEAEGEKPGSDDVTPKTPARQEGYLVLTARASSELLRRLQKWLRSVREAAPSAGCVSPPAMEYRRRLVAMKPLDKLGLVARTCHCALYALTDTLDDVGVTVQLLEYAKGTLHLSGDESIDCSPIKERSIDSSGKRKEFSEDEDEEEDADYLNVLGHLEESYVSSAFDDEDYVPTDEVSTDSEEYRQSETESDESFGNSDKEPARDAAKPPAKTAKGPSAEKTTLVPPTLKSKTDLSSKEAPRAGITAVPTAISSDQRAPEPPAGSADKPPPKSSIKTAKGPSAEKTTLVPPTLKSKTGPADLSSKEAPRAGIIAVPTAISSDQRAPEPPAGNAYKPPPKSSIKTAKGPSAEKTTLVSPTLKSKTGPADPRSKEAPGAGITAVPTAISSDQRAPEPPAGSADKPPPKSSIKTAKGPSAEKTTLVPPTLKSKTGPADPRGKEAPRAGITSDPTATSSDQRAPEPPAGSANKPPPKSSIPAPAHGVVSLSDAAGVPAQKTAEHKEGQSEKASKIALAKKIQPSSARTA